MVRQGKGPLRKEGEFDVNAPVTVAMCKSITVLRNNPKAKEGMEMLKRIASLVAPIMRKHGWELPLLGEFFPDNPNLLGINVNRGQKIFIRLRPQHAPDTFLDLETDLIGTMLHELTHNVIGPHDQRFYAFLDKLQDEYDELRFKGYSGEGFLSQGNKLSKERHDAHVPLHIARQKGLEAAMKRQQRNAVLGSASGYRLGGGQSQSNKSPRELAAEAAEKRHRDDKQCGHGAAINAEMEAAKAEQVSVNRVIDLTSSSSDEEDCQDIAPSASKSVASVPKANLLPDPNTSFNNATKRKEPTSPWCMPPARRPISKSKSEPGWICGTCTYINESPTALQCAVCETLRPDIASVLDNSTRSQTQTNGWECHICHTSGNDYNFWSCKLCGAIKTSSAV